MVTRCSSAWSKLTHHSSQPLSPIAWTKGLTFSGAAQDNEFFRGGRCHSLSGEM